MLGEEITIVLAEPLSVKKPPLINPNPNSATSHYYPVVERVFTEQIVSYWTNFIKYNNPNNKNSKTNIWAEFKNDESQQRNVIFLKAQNFKYTKFNILDAKCTFWNL